MESTTLRPRWWFVAAMGAAVFGLFLLTSLFTDVGPELLIGGVAGTAIGARSSFTVRTDADGLTFLRKRAAWPDMELHAGRFGRSLRTSLDGRPRRDQFSIHLPIFDADPDRGRLITSYLEGNADGRP